MAYMSLVSYFVTNSRISAAKYEREVRVWIVSRITALKTTLMKMQETPEERVCFPHCGVIDLNTYAL